MSDLSDVAVILAYCDYANLSDDESRAVAILFTTTATQRQVGRSMGYAHQYVHKLLRQALRKLRRSFRNQGVSV
jgi:DNA-directed RNA polymerase specialized sigma subunit